MRYKGLFCLLVLLQLFLGYALSCNPGNSLSPASPVFQDTSAPAVLRSQPLTPPTVAGHTSVLLENSEYQASARPDEFSLLSSLWRPPADSLFLVYGSKSSDLNASLLPMVARLLGLSSLVLRE